MTHDPLLGVPDPPEWARPDPEPPVVLGRCTSCGDVTEEGEPCSCSEPPGDDQSLSR